MRLRPQHLLLILSMLSNLSMWAQLSKEDSLRVIELQEIIEHPSHDTALVSAYAEWDALIYYYDSDLDYRLNVIIDSICVEKIKTTKSLEESHVYYNYLGNSNNNLGIIAYYQGDLKNALDHWTLGYEISNVMKDSVGMSSSLNNIGNVYSDQGDHIKGMEYYRKSLRIDASLGHIEGVGDTYNNIGTIFSRMGDWDSANYYYKENVRVFAKLNSPANSMNSIQNLGEYHLQNNDPDSALVYFEWALKLAKESQSNSEIGSISMDVANAHYLNKNYAQALKSGLEGMNYASGLREVPTLEFGSKTMYNIYKAMGNTSKALEYLEFHLNFKDTIQSEENQRAVIEKLYAFEYDKKAERDSLIAAENSKLEKAKLDNERMKNKSQKLQSYFLWGGLGLTALFGFFAFNRFRVTSRQKEIIEEQKSNVDHAYGELEIKNQEILDSIVYAKRIQSAILPPDNLIEKLLPESFVLYLPKDIVAGDFYWIIEQETKVLFAAADCTGHGVPGAMVSVVCNNALNRAVKEYGLDNPAQILDKTREIVVAEFEKSDEDVKDGMDIALCSLEKGANGSRKLSYAGAHNPLWVIRKGATEIEEYTADKQPVGKFSSAKAHTLHEIELNPGDSMYIFSDGYADQFGGENGKKFKRKNLRKLLLNMQDKTMQEQKTALEESFLNWKGTLEQLDDICIIGIQL